MKLQTKERKAFTLAEVLITLAIIGIVAALTIPTLVQNFQQKAWDTASEVFQRKLEEALKVMNAQGTLAGYTTTEAFVDELSKHIKITRICNNDDITTCFADKVYWGTDNDEIEMPDVKKAKNFGQENWNTNTVGVQFANGINAVIAYNPTETCKQDPYSNQIKGTSCLAILYDVDGFKNPNTSGKDLRGINVISLAGSNCFFELNGVCYGQPFRPDPVSKEECKEIQKVYPFSSGCFATTDYWASAVRTCKGRGNMPSRANLEDLALYFYNLESWKQSDLTLDEKKVAEAGYTLTNGMFYLFGNFQHGAGLVQSFEFYQDHLGVIGGYHDNGGANAYAVCLIND